MYICLSKVSSEQKVSSNLFISSFNFNLMENEVEVCKAGCKITCGENLAAVEDALYVIGNGN
jgi:hypothetical protein